MGRRRVRPLAIVDLIAALVVSAIAIKESTALSAIAIKKSTALWRGDSDDCC